MWSSCDLPYCFAELHQVRLDGFKHGLDLGCFLLFAHPLQTLEKAIERVMFGRGFGNGLSQPLFRLGRRFVLHSQAAAFCQR